MPDTLPIHRTNAGQEDVLVSLRRLVAARPDAPPPLHLGTPATGEEPLAPLVLAQAQRVRPPEAAEPMPDDALRALVSRAVRDELRGEIGTHLSRKLRRMVREEIALALQSRDLGR